MLYSVVENKIQTMLMCLSCDKYNQETKKCEGLNSVCYEYDPITKTIIDGNTGLPIAQKGE